MKRQKSIKIHVIVAMLCIMTMALGGCGKADNAMENVAKENSGNVMEDTSATTESAVDNEKETLDITANEEGSVEEDNTDKGMPASVNQDTIELDGLVVSFAEGRTQDLSDYEEVEVTPGSYQTDLLFTTENEIYNFSLYELQIVDVDDQGTPFYNKNEVYYKEALLTEKPLVLKVVFPGDMTTYGISYNFEGMDRRYTIMLSGMDGSLDVQKWADVYPDEYLSLPFSNEVPFDATDYLDVAAKANWSETQIDQCMEGIFDMMYHTGDIEDSLDSISMNCMMQEIDTESLTTYITKTTVWTGNEPFDKLMSSVGYTDYEVTYCYPYGLWLNEKSSYISPAYVCMSIDGNGYEYYFAENELVRRSGPEGYSDNPKTNDFINSIYKLGCYYGNILVGQRNRYNVMITSYDCIEKKEDSFVITGSLMGRDATCSFVIDKDTEFDDEVNPLGFTGIQSGESFFAWYSRAYDAIQNGEDWIDFIDLLGIWDVKTTKNHVDAICGSYWWD